MRKVLSICTIVMVSTSILFAGCRNKDKDEPTQPVTDATVANTTAESIAGETEQPTQEEATRIEYSGKEEEIPEDMKDIVKKSTEYDIGAYLYGDIDKDSEKELLAAYLDLKGGKWNIVLLENQATEVKDFYSIALNCDYDRCSLGLIDLKDKIHYVVNLSSTMGTNNGGYILEKTDDGVKEVMSLFKTIWQGDDEDIIVQNTSYGVCMDKTTGVLMGRTWTNSYLTYDEASGKYKEYVATDISEKDFLAYEGAEDICKSVADMYEGKNAKISYLKRNNGVMYIQCEYEKDNLIMYEYFVVSYDGNKITGKSEMQQGIVEKKATSLDEE